MRYSYLRYMLEQVWPNQKEVLFMALVFLDGTCGNNNWREPLIETLVYLGVPRESLFNPVVKNWTPEVQEVEERVKREASHHLYFLADPKNGTKSLSMYSAIEATMALYDRPESAIVIFDHSGLEGHALKASFQTEKVLRARFPSALIFDDLSNALDSMVRMFS